MPDFFLHASNCIFGGIRKEKLDFNKGLEKKKTEQTNRKYHELLRPTQSSLGADWFSTESAPPLPLLLLALSGGVGRRRMSSNYNAQAIGHKECPLLRQQYSPKGVIKH